MALAGNEGLLWSRYETRTFCGMNPREPPRRTFTLSAELGEPIGSFKTLPL